MEMHITNWRRILYAVPFMIKLQNSVCAVIVIIKIGANVSKGSCCY